MRTNVVLVMLLILKLMLTPQVELIAGYAIQVTGAIQKASESDEKERLQ